MQRMAHFLVGVCVLVLVAGCDDKKKKVETEPSQGSAMALDGNYSASAGIQTYPDPAASVAMDTGYTGSTMPPPATGEPTGGHTAGGVHTVVKGDTLFGLARLYYNDQSKWRTIYEANRTALTSPDSLKVGQQLVIP